MPDWMLMLTDLLLFILMGSAIVFAMLSFVRAMNGEKVKSCNYSICTLLSLGFLAIALAIFIDAKEIGKIQWIKIMMGLFVIGISYEILKLVRTRKKYILQEKKMPRKKRRRGHLRLIQ